MECCCALTSARKESALPLTKRWGEPKLLAVQHHIYRPEDRASFTVLRWHRGPFHLHKVFCPPHWKPSIRVQDDRNSTLFRYLAAAEALSAVSVKNLSFLICTASAFSERYLGMPLRDDSRYQVRVYRLPSLVCRWSLKAACRYITDTPTVKLPRLQNAAIKVRGSNALPFLVFFSCSVGFCHSSLFGNCVQRCVRSHAGGFFIYIFISRCKKVAWLHLRPPAQTRHWAIRGVFHSDRREAVGENKTGFPL